MYLHGPGDRSTSPEGWAAAALVHASGGVIAGLGERGCGIGRIDLERTGDSGSINAGGFRGNFVDIAAIGREVSEVSHKVGITAGDGAAGNTDGRALAVLECNRPLSIARDVGFDVHTVLGTVAVGTDERVGDLDIEDARLCTDATDWTTDRNG